MTDPSTADRGATTPLTSERPTPSAPQRPGGSPAGGPPAGGPPSDGSPSGGSPSGGAPATPGTAAAAASTGASAAGGDSRATGHVAPPPRGRRRPRRIVVAVVVLAVLLALVTAAGVHLFRTSTAWEDRAEEYRRAAEDLGGELATTRADLEGARGELEAVRAQLTTANERIVQLADEKAQLGDDREVQRQLVDYQQRVSEAAGTVALALDQCVQGQDQLIGYLQDAARYDPAELARFRDEVGLLCQQARDANEALQQELSE